MGCPILICTSESKIEELQKLKDELMSQIEINNQKIAGYNKIIQELDYKISSISSDIAQNRFVYNELQLKSKAQEIQDRLKERKNAATLLEMATEVNKRNISSLSEIDKKIENIKNNKNIKKMNRVFEAVGSEGDDDEIRKNSEHIKKMKEEAVKNLISLKEGNKDIDPDIPSTDQILNQILNPNPNP